MLRTPIVKDDHGMRRTMIMRAARMALAGTLVVLGALACGTSDLEAFVPTQTPTATSTYRPTPTFTPAPTVTPTLAPYVPAWPILKHGDGGLAEVFALQRLLRYRGRTVIADGRFGAQTLSAVKDLQTELGEPVDGLVGPVTWSALVEGLRLQAGDTGEAVKAAQYLLNKFRDPVTIDGDFGPQDMAALTVFEGAVGLQPDGVIDELTWQALAAFKPSVEPSLSYP